jgi:hypothetical protein
VAQFFEHDRTGGHLSYVSLDQVVVADYYTIGDDTPLLMLHLANGQDYQLQGSTAEEVANLLSNNTVARINTGRI